MAARSRGNGTNFDWLRESCDISTCDLSLDGNPEKYGRPMKSAIKTNDKGCTNGTMKMKDKGCIKGKNEVEGQRVINGPTKMKDK